MFTIRLAPKEAEEFIETFEPLIGELIDVDYSDGLTYMQIFADSSTDIPEQLRPLVTNLYEVTTTNNPVSFLATLPPKKSEIAVQSVSSVLEEW